MTESVRRLAARAAVDPHFLASALAEYARAHGLDDAGLAAALGTDAAGLAHARLCRTPRADPDGFRADVERVADRFGLDRLVLATAARLGQNVAAARAAQEAAASADAGAVLAARDRGEGGEKE